MPPPPDPDTESSLAATHVSGEHRAVQLPRGTALGRYFVSGLLGEGGMATVYAAYDPDLDRRVAIKLLKLSANSDLAGARAQLLREAQAMARLSHPNVVPVHDAGTFEGQLFVAMELIEGQTLRDWLEEKPRSTREILRTFVAAGEGLAAAHAAGLVHRDFKPANVLVGRDGRVRVSDFGLAHLEPRAGAHEPQTGRSSGETFAGSTAGTPAYMAPEQFTGASTDARTDQFCFCASLWEALTGELPFGEGDYRELRRKVLSGVLVIPRRPPPRWLRRLLVRGLGLRPEHRWPSMEVLLALLRRDRLRRVRHLAEGAALLSALAALSGIVGYQHHMESTRCERATRARLASLARGLHQPFPALGADGAELIPEVESRLSEWAAAQQAACEATAKGDPDGQRAQQCLEQYQARAQALIGYLPSLSAQKVNALLDELARPARCKAARAAGSDADSDPRLLQESAEVAALFDIGRHEEAAARGRALVAEARAAGAPHVAAFTSYYLALAIWEASGTSDEALFSISRQAVRDADLSGDGELSLRARVRLFDALGEGRGQLAEAGEVALDAEAWLRRLGYPPHLEALYATSRGNLLSRQGRHEEAVALFRRTIQLTEQVRGLRSPDLADAYNTLGAELMIVGRLAEAAETFETAIRLHEHARWRNPPEEALALGNLACTRLEQGRATDALPLLERAEQTIAPLGEELRSYHVWLRLQRALVVEDLGQLDEADKLVRGALAEPVGLETDDLCELHAAAARLLLARGRGREARVQAEEAAKIASERAAAPGARSQASFALAQALWATGEKERALALAREALQAHGRAEDSYRRGKIELWLADKARKP